MSFQCGVLYLDRFVQKYLCLFLKLVGVLCGEIVGGGNKTHTLGGVKARNLFYGGVGGRMEN